MIQKQVVCVMCNYKAKKKQIDPWLFVHNRGVELTVIAAPHITIMKGKKEDWLQFCTSFCLFEYLAKWYSHKIYHGGQYTNFEHQFSSDLTNDIPGIPFFEGMIGTKKPHIVEWAK